MAQALYERVKYLLNTTTYNITYFIIKHINNMFLTHDRWKPIISHHILFHYQRIYF